MFQTAKILFVSALLGAASTVSAATISTLFNTGVDPAGTPRADGSLNDLHYTLNPVAGGTSQTRIRTSVGGYPVGVWNGDDALSAWIGPNNDTQVDGPSGTYIYTTTFDLTGYNAITASITGQWATDDGGYDIVLNGNSTGQTGPFANFGAFSLTSGFVAGINTLSFYISNSGGPTGLRVEMTGSADADAVPEPATLGLMGLGLLGLATRRRR